MKKVGVVTATRAEYGLLKNTIRQINEDDQLELILIVTGTHLNLAYGNTVREIVEDGFDINVKIDYMSSRNDYLGIGQNMGNAMIMFSEYFAEHKLDMLVVLGDRYELLSICSAAMNAHIPIAHISGGETTEGAIDEAVRHCVTKMSYLHFPGCEEYKKRIIQLGENPDRVFNFGDVGVENIRKTDFVSREALALDLGIELDKKYFCVTFHPVTLENNSQTEQISLLLEAINELPEYNFIFTKSNADIGGEEINKQIDAFCEKAKNCFCFDSLGIRRYLSLLKYSAGVVGNSSSGIVEAPTLKIPTVNIGTRQEGRLKATSIIDCHSTKESIVAAINKSQSEEFISICLTSENPYGDGETSVMIKETIKDYLYNNKIDLKKKFYDVDFKY